MADERRTQPVLAVMRCALYTIPVGSTSSLRLTDYKNGFAVDHGCSHQL
ncbi:MAG: hypothetical protein NW701_03570 [Nitrospira sp.]